MIILVCPGDEKKLDSFHLACGRKGISEARFLRKEGAPFNDI